MDVVGCSCTGAGVAAAAADDDDGEDDDGDDTAVDGLEVARRTRET